MKNIKDLISIFKFLTNKNKKIRKIIPYKIQFFKKNKRINSFI